MSYSFDPNLPQAGVPSITAIARAESPDGLKVKLLVGTHEGLPGDIVVYSTQKALAEIAAGRAVAL